MRYQYRVTKKQADEDIKTPYYWLNPFYYLHYLPDRHQILAIILIIFLLLLLLSLFIIPISTSLGTNESSNKIEQSTIPENKDNIAVSSNQPMTSNGHQNISGSTWNSLFLEEGQTLEQLFAENNYPVEDAIAIIVADNSAYNQLKHLPAGQEIRIMTNPEGQVAIIDIEVKITHQRIIFIRQSNGSYLSI